MLVRTDDEVYRVDAVWLGPPRATFPWRARYVSYGVGLLVMMLIMFIQRRLGIGLEFFSVAWALVGTVAITRLLGKKIDYERPLGQVLGQFWAEVTGPRAGRKAAGGSVRASHVRVQTTRAHPGSRSSGGRGRTLGAPRRRSLDGTGATPRPGAGTVVEVAPATVPGPGSASAPVRVVPPLPEPGSAPRRSRLRRARGGGGGRGTSVPARTSRPDPWRRSGHRGRT
ncbi:hypothetical protein [Pseudonocardia sp. ICBG1293]|uniref:hypothetical protein n=1 Tax=Pseudonocardia sp. ICBG1293 TaxID=2844382 RepID=UPI001CCDA629|nr:hypothetical protein [Pseudonocardia sp. ICBG1293]